MSSVLPNEGTTPLPEYIPDAPEGVKADGGRGYDENRAYEIYSAQKFHDQERHVYNICTGGQIISGVDGKLEV
jgi:hypothetical protein